VSLIEINTNPTPRQLRQFAGIWFPAFCGVVGGLLWYRAGLPTVAMTLWAGAAVFAVAGLMKPMLARPVFVAWMVFAFPIGWMISHLCLAVVYYLMITPTGLIMRCCGRDPAERKLDRSAKTYWNPREPVQDTRRYFRQF
jgi:hypothetical protein